MQPRTPIMVDDRLRRLDHWLDPKRAGRQPIPFLDDFESPDCCFNLLRQLNFWNGNDESRWQLACRFAQQCGHEDVEGANTAFAQIFAERFYPDADERRERVRGETARDFAGSRGGMAIFFFVGAVAIAVLKIETEIFDRFAL